MIQQNYGLSILPILPQGPGLGVKMDWDYIEGHKRSERVFE